ncbi:MAG: hypothetical protein ACRDSH_23970 [Pseudonocardiaceae bacterium]
MGSWSFVLGPASGGHTVALTGAKNRKLTARLMSPSEASFDIDGRHPEASYVQELSTDLHCIYDPDVGPTSIIYRGRIGNLSDNLDASSHTLTVPSMDYRELLKRRLLYNSSTLSFVSQDQADIALNLIGQTQALPGGDLSISKGLGNPSGIVRTLSYVAGDSIGDQIQTLSQLQNGFDWEITPVSPSALALNIWTSVRGASRGVVLEYGGIVQSIRREVRSSDYANSVRVTGDQTATTPPTPQERTAVDIATRAEGRWDKALPAPGTIDLAALQSRADYMLAYSQTIIPSYTLVLKRGAWAGPGHVWLGDTVTLVIKSGRLAVVDSSLRVQEVAVDIAEDGIDAATLTLGRPALNYNSWPSLMDQRIRDLERR